MAEEAVYYNGYMTNLRLTIPRENKHGGPTDQTMLDNSKLQGEADSELYTLCECVCKMEELTEGNHVTWKIIYWVM